MSRWRRPVHCRHCGESGHNINGCAKLKEYAKNNPESWTAQKMKQRQEAAKHRECSYCNEEKHNRKTCKHLFQDVVQVYEINKKFRRKFLQVCREKGLGIGALVRYNVARNGYNSNGEWSEHRDVLGMIVDVNWDEITIPANYGINAFRIQYCNLFEYNGMKNIVACDDVPPWRLYGFEQHPSPSRWESKEFNLFDVVSPGHVIIDDEEKWISDIECVKQKLHDNFPRHADVMHQLEKLKYIV